MYSTIKEAINNFSDWQVCETVLWAKTSEKSYKLSNDNEEVDYIPIGLYVVPAEHIHDGLHRFMSLKFMNFATPSEGSINLLPIYWGNSNIEGLKNFSKVNIYKDDNSLKPCILSAKDSNDNILAKKLIIRGDIDNILTTNDMGYLPSDYFGSGYADKLNSSFLHSSTENKIPCPYGTDDLLNPCFIDTTVNPNNALADFSGKQNTKIIVKSATSQSDWKTASSISNNSDAGYTPAACCCQRYNPDGFSEFQWYLPSLGELVYVCAKHVVINTKLASLNDNYSGLIISSLPDIPFWSSTSPEANYAYNIFFGDGTLTFANRTLSFCVLSFLSA